ncbi:ATP-binding protein [Ramlibacter humi]|uniref:histidine kinase n=1 Tax=Ramlibacter humi TaxID=2530451 RepID=A0A4Z0CBE2_9BURK|nr:ATP-binding protein [Ramlibacter humi]TFZ07738.1 GAF domain-containing protein [Ramlibacter humi]
MPHRFQPSAPQAPVTLDNCDREPIHVPGHVQPHGALLAFGGDGMLHWASQDAGGLLQAMLPSLGQKLAEGHFDADGVARGAIEAVLSRGSARVGMVDRHEVAFGSRTFDLLVHHNGHAAVAEFEIRSGDGAAERTGFAGLAYTSMARLRQQRSIRDLLDTAVVELRAIAGFDRVMAYRFRHDASGDVVAEACREDLEPFLHRRYPASDIPAQARRLYVLNTVRQIADVGARPVPLVADVPSTLDMSWCSLRSVSPIHIEYLTNMGVAASMSVSIVIGGHLWGMLACHHMSPKVVPYAMRTAADVLAQLLASSVQTLLSAEHSRQLALGSELRVRLIEKVTHADATMAGITPFAQELCALFHAEALVASEGTETFVHGGVPAEAAGELVRWLRGHSLPRGMLCVSSRAELPPELAESLWPYCGLMALRMEEEGSGWLVLLRKEQVETIEWGGRPEKQYVPGPNGPRLTPRGSFDVWRETVRGITLPWTDTEKELGSSLRGELLRATVARQAQMARARDQMFAVLGHDLRNPLQTIAMASQMLQRGADGAKIGQRISRSSSQMARLITDVLDVSRLQAGIGLGVQPEPVDVAAVLREIAQDSRIAHPSVEVALDAPFSFVVPADAARLEQLLDNLLGNARQHGEPGHPVRVALRREGSDAVVSVANQGPPIPGELASQLFNPYKRQSVGNERNRGGLGLGLYIANEIARAHGGTLSYRYQAPDVVFTFRWPGAGA